MLKPSLFLHMVDPRGRADRKGLLIAASVLLVLQVAAVVVQTYATGVPFAAILVLHVAILWSAVVCAVKRLHDIGLSGWRVFGGFLALFAWSFVLAGGLIIGMGLDPAPGSAAFNATYIGTMLPAFAMLLWLHFAKGMVGENRFGPVTDASGFAWPVDNSKRIRQQATA